jgi:hypothetical protein
MTPFSKRTKADIFREYFNDWLTVSEMAANYGMDADVLHSILEKGKIEHNVINPIIERKAKGIDCTENESAEIKQYIKHNAEYPPEIMQLFPLEYGEAIDEMFNQIK